MDKKTTALSTTTRQKRALETIDEKFNVGDVMNHLNKMMKGVTDKEMTPDTVMAACQCVSKMNEVMDTTINAAKFLKDND